MNNESDLCIRFSFFFRPRSHEWTPWAEWAGCMKYQKIIMVSQTFTHSGPVLTTYNN